MNKSRPSTTAALVMLGFIVSVMACVSAIILPLWNHYVEIRRNVSQDAASGTTVFVVLCLSGLMLYMATLRKGGE